jgi:hypothetical protein
MPHNGCATSSTPDTSHEAMLTSGQLSMFEPATSPDIPSAISSPASAAGASPCASPDGPTTDLFGQGVAPASRSAPPAKEAVARTSGTYGRIGSVSSASEDLASSLARMLRQRLDGAGSTLFSATWKRKVTPRGRPYWEHTASARRTSGSDCGSWQSPMARTNRKSARAMARSVNNGRRSGGGQSSSPGLEQQAEMASWPTTRATDSKAAHERANTRMGQTLIGAALASWPTPMAGTPAQKGYNEAGNNDSSRKTVDLCSWPTPAANQFEADADVTETRRAKYREKYGNNGFGLTTAQAAQLASWPTPDAEQGRPASQELIDRRKAEGKKTQVRLSAAASWAMPTSRDHKDGASTLENTPVNALLGRQVLRISWATPRVTSNGGHGSPKRAEDGRARLEDQVHGPTSSGSPAQTEKRGQLNEDFSRWLQGYPAVWSACAPNAKRRQK